MLNFVEILQVLNRYLLEITNNIIFKKSQTKNHKFIFNPNISLSSLH
jgi:hypothetical protein